MVVLSALLMVFIIVSMVSLGGGLNLFQAQETAASLRNAHALAAAVNFVYLAGDGASYNLTLANMANDENITTSDFAATSQRPHSSGSAPLLEAGVNASSVGRGDVQLSNAGGEVHVGN